MNFKFFFFMWMIVSYPLFGYIGPGMSGGLIATILGIIGSIFLAIFGYSVGGADTDNGLGGGEFEETSSEKAKKEINCLQR